GVYGGLPRSLEGGAAGAGEAAVGLWHVAARRPGAALPVRGEEAGALHAAQPHRRVGRDRRVGRWHLAALMP
ncbi:MAG: hypothetical protein ACPIOQ_29480, partial [Promethearchaeia archaeon]